MPIPGTTKLHRLEENTAAASLTLDAANLNQINKAVAAIEIQGARYSAQAQQMINR
ncbi:hypothetical protein [Cnuella takakiae]|uniref:hypothetical protein n=1 Tax=Cnuella takakiae TaxID=1302690 RepID=UPI000B025631|nr:hypothetical protein [Cnuella takakiae]